MPQVPGTVYVPYKAKDHEIEITVGGDGEAEDDDGSERFQVDRYYVECLYCGWEHVFDDYDTAYFAGRDHVKELSGHPIPAGA